MNIGVTSAISSAKSDGNVNAEYVDIMEEAGLIDQVVEMKIMIQNLLKRKNK